MILNDEAFYTWWGTTNLGVHSTSETIAKCAWHARDDEIADLKRQLAPTPADQPKKSL